MMTDRELMQQALSALVTAEHDGNCEYGVTDSLRARLAQPEPMIDGWPLWSGLPPVFPGGGGGSGEIESQKIYRTIKQREWIGLTEDDLVDTLWPVTLIDVVRLVEGKLKEKNGG
jgi:hypothetical protein